MTGDRSRRGASSTSRPRPSRRSNRSAGGSSASRSTGEPAASGLGAAAVRDLARRHGVRPTKSLGQHFLIDPNLARAIVADAEIRADDRVVEIGPGFGSLTLALAAAGASVVAVEIDRRLAGALEEVVTGLDVRVVTADAMRLDWDETLGAGTEPWTLCANLPYQVATPLVLDVLEHVPAIERVVVMVQREVGERLVAGPGDEGYGAPSLRVGYRARGSLVRRVPPEVFWPRPTVASVIVRLDRLERPPVEVDEASLWRVVDAGFAERRKTIRNALRRLGLQIEEADRALDRAGVEPGSRAEELDLPAFARLAELVG